MLLDLGWDNHLPIIFFSQNANVTFKAVKTTTVDLTVANVNVKMDILEFIVNCQLVRFFSRFCHSSYHPEPEN